MTGGLLRCTPSAWFKGEYPCPGKPRCRVFQSVALCIRDTISFSSMSSLEIVLPKYLNVSIFFICVPSISGNAWRLGEIFWCGLKETFCITVADCQAKHLGCVGELVHNACRGLSWWAINAHSSANRASSMSLSIVFL